MVGSSYAGVLKGHPLGVMSESEKRQELRLASASPPRDGFPLTDDAEFPPMSPGTL
ncbi:hypothetical protein J6590_016116 [Homalodisca vitripennis]|nr:hypothetical protein J6590_016116 [Homalodisca vitripennis]